MHESLMEVMWDTGHLSGSNAEYVEQLYENFLADSDSIPQQWREFFESLPAANGDGHPDVSHSDIKNDFKALGKVSRYVQVLSNDAVVNSEHERKQVQVLLLISSYRVRGHQKAKLDPLGIMHRERVPDLELEFHDLSPIDYSTIFQTGSLFISKLKAPLKEIVDTIGDWMAGIGFLQFAAAGFAAFGGYVVGTVELIAALLLLIRKTQAIGATLALVVISGAIFFHLVTPLGVNIIINEAGDRDGGQLFAMAVLIFFSSLLIMWLRRDSLATLFGANADDHEKVLL